MNVIIFSYPWNVKVVYRNSSADLNNSVIKIYIIKISQRTSLSLLVMLKAWKVSSVTKFCFPIKHLAR